MHEDKQIQGMVDFIERDAHEKARELEDEANAQYNSEKANYVEVEKKKVLANYEKRKADAEINRRVSAASHSQEQRMRLLDNRRELLDTLQNRVQQKIKGIINDQNKYTALLQNLLNQAAVSVRADAEVTVRQQDVNVMKSLFKKAEAEVQRITGKKISLSVNTNEYLSDEEDWGGLILVGFNGQIVCQNTLAIRAKHVFEEQIPTVRHLMFQENAKF